MIQNIYPLFERGRIMKKELMLAIRNYSFEYVAARYQEFSDGVIFGCSLKVHPDGIEIGIGGIKYGGFIYLVSEPMRVAYAPTDRMTALKVRFYPAEQDADSIRHAGELVLEESLECEENELELCRFRLQRGSRLRDDYKSMEDIETGFDTLNLANSSHAAVGGMTLSPAITERFAQEALTYRLENPWDITFCAQCMTSGLAVPRALIQAYVTAKLGLDKQELDNRALFDKLVLALRQIQGGQQICAEQKRRFRQQIIVD